MKAKKQTSLRRLRAEDLDRLATETNQPYVWMEVFEKEIRRAYGKGKWMTPENFCESLEEIGGLPMTPGAIRGATPGTKPYNPETGKVYVSPNTIKNLSHPDALTYEVARRLTEPGYSVHEHMLESIKDIVRTESEISGDNFIHDRSSVRHSRRNSILDPSDRLLSQRSIRRMDRATAGPSELERSGSD